MENLLNKIVWGHFIEDRTLFVTPGKHDPYAYATNGELDQKPETFKKDEPQLIKFNMVHEETGICLVEFQDTSITLMNLKDFVVDQEQVSWSQPYADIEESKK